MEQEHITVNKEMITKDSIEAAYAFFHQKWRVYEYSHSERQKDDIEYAIADYVGNMSPELYARLADGRKDFLYDHDNFASDISKAIDKLDNML